LKKKSQIIIDGYNLLKSVDIGTIRKEKLEIARENLLQLLNSFQQLSRHEIVVVFDSNSAEGSKNVTHFGKIKVVFSGQGMEADDIIKHWIRKKGDKSSLTIVSSDNEIKNTAKDHGVKVLGSKEFWIKHRKAIPPGEKSSFLEKEKHLSDREVKEWLKLFQNKAKNSEKI
jgi:predicted RNA-binding protein with PIN domain